MGALIIAWPGKVGAFIIVWRGKAYLPCQAQTEAGYYMNVEPVYVAGLNAEELLSAIQKVLGAELPRVPTPTREEWKRQMSRTVDPVLKATKARRWKELTETGASYLIWWIDKDKEIRVEMSRPCEKSGWWESDPGKRRIFPPDTPLEEIVAVILEDIRSRPEVWG